MSFNLGSSLMESMFFLNETEEGFTLLKPVTEAPCSPIFSPKEDLTASTTPTKLKSKYLLEKDVSDGTLNLKKSNSLTPTLAYLF